MADTNIVLNIFKESDIDIHYLALPVESAVDIDRQMMLLLNKPLSLDEVESGLVAKVGSKAALNNFEGIIGALDSGFDAIMIDQINLGQELINEEQIKKARA